MSSRVSFHQTLTCQKRKRRIIQQSSTVHGDRTVHTSHDMHTNIKTLYRRTEINFLLSVIFDPPDLLCRNCLISQSKFYGCWGTFGVNITTESFQSVLFLCFCFLVVIISM